MRRGTPAAKQFGRLIRDVRGNRTMREIGDGMGIAAATISQMESGDRACKMHRIEELAKALNVEYWDLLDLWWLCQGSIPTEPSGSYIQAEDKGAVAARIVDVMKDLYPGWRGVIDISMIKPSPPISRIRGSAPKLSKMEEMFQKLNAHQRSRVFGYMESLLDED